MLYLSDFVPKQGITSIYRDDAAGLMVVDATPSGWLVGSYSLVGQQIVNTLGIDRQYLPSLSVVRQLVASTGVTLSLTRESTWRASADVFGGGTVVLSRNNGEREWSIFWIKEYKQPVVSWCLEGRYSTRQVALDTFNEVAYERIAEHFEDGAVVRR